MLLSVSPDPIIDLVNAVEHLQTELYPLFFLVPKIRNLQANLIYLKLQGFNFCLHYIQVLTVYSCGT